MLSRPDVAVVDDHLLIGETVQSALTARGIDAVAVPVQPVEFLAEQLMRLSPRVVLLDLDLGEYGSSLPVIPQLVGVGVTVLMMTGVTDRVRVAEAFEAGAVGCQPKSAGFEALVSRAVAALAGEPAESAAEQARRSDLLAELAQSRSAERRRLQPFQELTDRESEALRALCDGSSVRDIAADWVVSEATVRTHVRGVLTKLNARSQLAAVVAATRSGWLARR